MPRIAPVNRPGIPHKSSPFHSVNPPADVNLLVFCVFIVRAA